MTLYTRDPVTLCGFAQNPDSDFEVMEVFAEDRPEQIAVNVRVAKVRFVPLPEAPPEPQQPVLEDIDHMVEWVQEWETWQEEHMRWEDDWCEEVWLDGDVEPLVEHMTHLGAYMHIRSLMARGYRCPLSVLNTLVVLHDLTLAMLLENLETEGNFENVEAARTWSELGVTAGAYFHENAWWSAATRTFMIDRAREQ